MQSKKFTILGETRSGKTCYLLGMYMSMNMDLESIGYTIVAKDAPVRKNLTLNYKKLEDDTRGEGRFPDTTDQVQKYNFDLQYGFETILPFEWIDYPGNFLDPTLADTNDAQYRDVEKSIRESSALFICIDGENLVKGNTDAKIRRVKRKCVARINPYLGELKDKLKSENKRLPPICIIVTKADLCADYLNDGELRKIIEESFKPLFLTNDTIIAVVAVSLGTDIKDDSYKGELDPVNVHLPILFGINYALNEVIVECNSLMWTKNNRISSMARQKSDEEDSFFLFRDDEKINRLADNISTTEKEKEQIFKTAKIAEKNQNKVWEELRTINMFFYDGRWTL